MVASLLVTSFTPWRAHQRSNSADELVALAVRHPLWPPDAIPLRRLPVHFELASMQVLRHMVALRPAVVVCCGMAETRSHLTLEQYARRGDRRLGTDLDLSALCDRLGLTTISDDAGDYVCNHLYFEVLTAIAAGLGSDRGLFVHVPCLHPRTQPWLLLEFLTVLHRLRAIASQSVGSAQWAPLPSQRQPLSTDPLSRRSLQIGPQIKQPRNIQGCW